MPQNFSMHLKVNCALFILGGRELNLHFLASYTTEDIDAEIADKWKIEIDGLESVGDDMSPALKT